MPSKALQMLIPEGDPSGMKILMLSGWPGKCFIVPRQNLRELKNRIEVNQPALYFLFGLNEETEENLAYIGQTSTSFYERIAFHDKDKDFWNTAIIFTGEIDGGDARYLEQKSILLARKVNRISLINGVTPGEENLSEFARVRPDQYFETILFILQTLSYEIFDVVQESISDAKLYFLKSEGANAFAQLLKDGSLNVVKGSYARKRETIAFTGWAKEARRRFLEDGTLIDTGDGISYLYTKDIVFRTPSAAAATTVGSPINGWTAWKDKDGNTLDDNLRK